MRAFIIGGVIAFATLWPGQVIAPAAAKATRNPCSTWDSRYFPPPSVRVLVKAHGGYVVERDFRTYVAEVMAAGAWPASKPWASLVAGAQAIKQYAWWEVLHRPCDRVWKGEPYDIENGGIHQLWRPKTGVRKPTPLQVRAVKEGWFTSIRKHGRFIRTGWSGEGGSCGEVRDGFHLLEDGATDCARRGYTWQRIQRVYYGPRFQRVTAKPWRHPELVR